MRKECASKATLLSCLAASHKIGESPQMRDSWELIYDCKVLGLFVENYAIALLSLLMLALSLGLVVLSHQVSMGDTERGVLFVACFGVDADLLGMFYAGVRL